MARDKAYTKAEKKIEAARRLGATELDLSAAFDAEDEERLTELPDSLWQLTQLQSLDLSHNQLTTLPELLSQLTQLYSLGLSSNKLTTLPDSLGQFTQLHSLDLSSNKLTTLPDSLSQLTQLKTLDISRNQVMTLPKWLWQTKHWCSLDLSDNNNNEIKNIKWEGVYTFIFGNEGTEPFLDLSSNKIEVTSIFSEIAQLDHLVDLFLDFSNISDLPSSFAQLEHLKILNLDNNPLNPALQSAYDQGFPAVMAYLRSLDQNAKPLYEAKLVIVGEGNVGKTTLLKALKRSQGEEAPKEREATTHGVEIDIHALRLQHPKKEDVKIQLNAWDFGGQDVYRVTHQFFFSRRSLYLLAWEPRRGVQQCQVEDWLNMIRLRVGDAARVIIISTYSQSGGHIARIDKDVFKQQYGEMIVGFYEVDSLVHDADTSEMVGIAALKTVIAQEAAKLEQMGMLFNNDWKAARDELIASDEPRISYSAFGETCARHGLSQIDTDVLAHLMHDLGYIVHYSDDEKLRHDVVLKPQWLTKAIGFVLEDRATQESEGILPDEHLYQVWHEHPFEGEPRYEPALYPFFLRLMEQYDVSYRLPEERHASLVAQHVPQIRPALGWLPEHQPPANLRRIAMICAMEEDPPGLVPWMIVRTHDYALEQHPLHWQKGMFLQHGTHGEAMLEKRGREFHIYAQAAWPEHFMNVLHSTLEKLITDNWPGLKGRYRFMVPCPEVIEGQPCKGRFNIHTLRQFWAEGDPMIRCQECGKRQSPAELLLGFEERSTDIQLREINEKLDGLNSRIADYFMATMRAIADEAKHGPRLFTLRGRNTGPSPKTLFSRPLEIQLWCEAEGCQHPVSEPGKGVYALDKPREWLVQVAPYASFALKVLATVTPIVAPAINSFFGPKTTETWNIADHLDLANAIIGELPEEVKAPQRGPASGNLLGEGERSGLLALHRLLNELDPSHSKLGLHRIPTYTGDYRWLCQKHYEASLSKIPDVIEHRHE